ncbi:MAG TPA: wax ester/triacylglycerol synthase family O-acyltransferase [Acidimicrobiales bacterium]|nr:wax ester/triacylglycerol synthase family O-acyltransferase [Acidimicrobiales bacterium]
MAPYEPLAPLDAFFLYLESPATPMHLGSVAIFEGGPLRDRHGVLRIGAIRDEIASRLHLVPALRRRVRFPAGGGTAPVWVDDAGFDIGFHVRHVAVPAPGSDADLTDLCAELMAVPLDRARPLWEMWFVEGLAGGRVALVEKLHHAMADGMASVELATVLLDLERRPAEHHPARPWHPRPGPTGAAAVARDLAHRGTAAVRAGTRALGAIVDPAAAGRGGTELLEGLGTLASPRTIAPTSSINVPVTRGRRFAVVRRDLGSLRIVEERFGVTLNDVVLAAVTGGLRVLLAGRGESTGGRSLRALVPVGADHHGDRRLGNRVSALLVPLPLGAEDPVARLRSVADAVGVRKARHQALVGEALLGLLDPMPTRLLATLTPLVHHQRLCNLVVTNVPGPQFPLYAMGARMLEVFPVVPLAGNLSVGVAVFTYDGQLTVGILADRERCRDVAVLAAGVDRSFAELVSAATGGHSRRPAPESLGVSPARPRGGSATRHVEQAKRSAAANDGARRAAPPGGSVL